MRIASFRLSSGNVAVVIGLIYAYGAFLGIAGLVWSWLEKHEVPHLTWWQFLLSPFAIGATMVALEGFGTFVLRGFTIDQTESKVRLVLGQIVFVVVLLVLLIGLPIYKMSQQ